MSSAVSRRLIDLAAVLFVVGVAVGGYFVRELGLLLALLMGTAVTLTLTRPKPRVFCSSVCPRGRALGFALGPVSRRRPLPRLLVSRAFRRFLCGFMLFCVTMSLFRPGHGGELLAWGGTVFWTLCVISLAAGLVLGLIFKPRAWCAICPLGTLQDTIREGRQKG